MKKLLLFLVVLSVMADASAQQYKWGKLFDGHGVVPSDMAVDNAGNKYITGSLAFGSTGDVDLDPGPGTYMLNENQGMGFYAKYDSSGNFVWGRQLELPFAKIRLTPSGNLLAAGIYVNSTTDLDPGSGITTLTAYGTDLVLATYSAADGSFISAKQFETLSNLALNPGLMTLTYSNSLDIDSQGNIYLCGNFSGYVDLDLNGSFTNVFDMGSGAGYILKYDSSYNLVYGYTISNAVVTSLRYDPTLQYTYVTGLQHISAPGNSNIFMAKFDNTGNPVWFDSLSMSNGSASVFAGVTDINLDEAEHVYIHGNLPMSTTGFIDFDPGPGITAFYGPAPSVNGSNGFLAKYTGGGDLIWARKVGGSGLGSIRDMAIDAGNNLVCHIDIGAAYPGVVNASLDIANNTVDTSGRFIALYDTAANLLQYKCIGTPTAPYANLGHSWMKIQDKDIYLCGHMYNSFDFDPYTALGNLSVADSNGGNAGYLVRYNQCPDNYTVTADTFCAGTTYPFGTQILTASGSYTEFFNIGNRCDSLVTLNLSARSVDVTVTQSNNTLTAGADNAGYQWLNCSSNTPVPGAAGKHFTPATSGTYKVVVTQKGCSDTSQCLTVDLTGIGQPEFAKHISVFPNPVGNQLNISYSAVLPVEKIALTDITGRLLQMLPVKDRSDHIHINVKSLQPGIYLLRLTAGEEQAVFKFVKQ